MKKIIALFLLLSMIFAFVSCKPSENKPDTEQPPTGNTDDGIFEPDAELVSEMKAVLPKMLWFINPGLPYSLHQHIDMIAEGYRISHVVIDSSDCYFVCAYYQGNRIDEGAYGHPNINQYTWVGFRNASDVKECYNDLNLISVFMVNNASVYTDLLTGESVNYSAAHFMVIPPEFKNGILKIPSKKVDYDVLYLSEADLTELYLTSSIITPFYYRSIPCVKIGGIDYLVLSLGYERTDGTGYDTDLENEFGDYYDRLMSAMITVEYTMSEFEGTVQKCGLISIDDFASIIMEKIKQNNESV